MTDDENMSQARANRKERRKGNAVVRKTKPLARLGVPIFTGVARVVLNTPDGPQTKYYWWADENGNLSPEELEKTELHGPFDAEAKEAARIAVIGPDCEMTEGGTRNPAWEKPQ
jgi:hypothetical protein